MNPIRPEELAELLDRHGPALEFYAAQWTQSPSDVVQEAFIELAAASVAPERIAAWLYRVVRCRAMNAARAAQRRRHHETSAAERQRWWFKPHPDQALDAKLATEALHQLPLETREVVIARLWGGLTFEQIAEAYGMSTSAAYRRYQTALEQLRERLKSCENKNLCGTSQPKSSQNSNGN